jgi:hypothetical protein
MTDPVSFTTTTPSYALPLLFSGQAAKEFYVNEAHSLTDALLHPACEREAADPPPAPGEGEAWLVAAAATGAWAGHDAKLASYQAGNWLFVSPKDGMRLFDKSSGQLLLFSGGWKRATAPAEPSGGTTIDTEARTALTELIAALAEAGILPSA